MSNNTKPNRVQLQALAKGSSYRDVNSAAVANAFRLYGGVGDAPVFPTDVKVDAHHAVLRMQLSQLPREDLIKFIGLVAAMKSLKVPLNETSCALMLERNLMNDAEVVASLKAKVAQTTGIVAPKAKYFPSNYEEVLACFDRDSSLVVGGVDVKAHYAKWRKDVLTDMMEPEMVISSKSLSASDRGYVYVTSRKDIGWVKEGDVDPSFINVAYAMYTSGLCSSKSGDISQYSVANFRSSPVALKNQDVAALFGFTLVDSYKKHYYALSDTKHDTPLVWDKNVHTTWGCNSGSPRWVAEGMYVGCQVKLSGGRFYSSGTGIQTEVPGFVLKAMLARFLAVGGQQAAKAMGYLFADPASGSGDRVLGQVRSQVGMYSAVAGDKTYYLDLDWGKCLVQTVTATGTSFSAMECAMVSPVLEFSVVADVGRERYTLLKEMPDDVLTSAFSGFDRCHTCLKIEKNHKCDTVLQFVPEAVETPLFVQAVVAATKPVPAASAGPQPNPSPAAFSTQGSKTPPPAIPNAGTAAPSKTVPPPQPKQAAPRPLAQSQAQSPAVAAPPAKDTGIRTKDGAVLAQSVVERILNSARVRDAQQEALYGFQSYGTDVTFLKRVFNILLPGVFAGTNYEELDDQEIELSRLLATTAFRPINVRPVKDMSCIDSLVLRFCEESKGVIRMIMSLWGGEEPDWDRLIALRNKALDDGYDFAEMDYEKVSLASAPAQPEVLFSTSNHARFGF